MIENLIVYNSNARGVYRGITRQFFPKWEGWSLIETGASQFEVDKAAESFYMTYFYYPLKLDLLNDDKIAIACLNFATSEGKKKLISKLQKTTNSLLQGALLIEQFNNMGKYGQVKLMLELLDHYTYFNKYEDGCWIIDLYRDINL